MVWHPPTRHASVNMIPCHLLASFFSLLLLHFKVHSTFYDGYNVFSGSIACRCLTDVSWWLLVGFFFNVHRWQYIKYEFREVLCVYYTTCMIVFFNSYSTCIQAAIDLYLVYHILNIIMNMFSSLLVVSRFYKLTSTSQQSTSQRYILKQENHQIDIVLLFTASQNIPRHARNQNHTCFGQALLWLCLHTYTTKLVREEKHGGRRSHSPVPSCSLWSPIFELINSKYSLLFFFSIARQRNKCKMWWWFINTMLTSSHYQAAELQIKSSFNDHIVRQNKLKCRLIASALRDPL